MVVSVNEELREQTRSTYDAVASDYATIVPDTGFEAPLYLAIVNEFVSEVAKRPGVIPSVLATLTNRGQLTCPMG